MAFITTIAEEQAEGLLQDIYQNAQKSSGYVPNYTKAFSLRPDVYAAWMNFLGSIRSKMRLRRYELVTFAAAMALKCTYWLLAHGAVLRKNFFSAEELAAITQDFRNAGLSPEEVAMMAFAQKVITNTHRVSELDFDVLRQHGFSDEEILDIVLTATARSFFSKTLDAVGAVPDEAYLALGPELVALLSMGRPFP